MRILIVLLLLNIQIQAQELRFSYKTIQYNTVELKAFTDTIFNQPPWIQPIVHIDYAPLYPGVLGLTRKIGPNRYMVDINPLFPSYLLEETLRHELIHVRQFHLKELQLLPIGFLWKGKLFPFQTPYKTRPWEVEARHLSRSGSSAKSAHPHNTNNINNNLNKDNKLDKLSKDIIPLNIQALLALLLIFLSVQVSLFSKD
jgi:hypothetical protein